MAEASSTFSESWYRIANQSLSLRGGLKAHRQFFRGEKWYVLHDPYNNQFFRLRPAAWEFVARLGRTRTVEDAWKECLRLNPEEAPGQEEVIRLLAQLYHANLLAYTGSEDSLVLFKRFERQREREIRSRLVSFMFPRITLLDPDRFLAVTMPWVRWLFGWGGALLWLAVVALGAKAAVDGFGELVDQGQALLAPGNWAWLYLALVLVKVLHEFGHAYACRRAGGEVHRMGVMFLIFTPLPFVDATAAWSLRSRRSRALVGAAGMLVELFLAAVAALVWSRTAPGLLHSLCYNVMFIASVSTLIFNGNPLLRFDGYYILSDLLDIPNLHERSMRQVRFVMERYLFGVKEARSLARSRSEATQAFVYAVLSLSYRIAVFGSVILFVADRMLVLGMLLAAGFFLAWVVVPVVRFLHYLASAPELGRRRGRAFAVSAAILAAIVLLVRIIPFPQTFQAPGVLEGDPFSRVYAEAPGFLAAAGLAPGAPVAKGAVVAELRNPELDFELCAAEARLAELDAYERRALQESAADLAPLRALRASIEGQRGQLLRRKKELTVLAPQDGRWGGEELAPRIGMWLNKGEELGLLVSGPPFVFRAVVSESEASRLFNRQILRAELRFVGQAGVVVAVAAYDVIPAERRELPSEVLGWQAGGEVRTDPRSASGAVSAEPFFEVAARVGAAPGATLRHGLAGRIRFELPADTLWNQWSRKARQFLQARYRL